MRAASVFRPASPRHRSPTWAAERSRAAIPPTTASLLYELKTWQLRAYLTQYKVESDGDLHLVLNDSTGRHMVAEIPDGSCVPSSSRWTSQIATARYALTHNYTVTTSWHYVHRLVDARGLDLFDVVHGQTGAASNGIELHPCHRHHVQVGLPPWSYGPRTDLCGRRRRLCRLTALNEVGPCGPL